MIISNGTIEIMIKSAGGLDSQGYPVAPSISWGALIPCQYIAKSNLQAKVENEPATQQSYEVLIEQPLIGYSVTEQVRLKDRSGIELGIFPVRMIEPLDAVGQIRLLI